MGSSSTVVRVVLPLAALFVGGVSFAVSNGNGASPYAAWVTPVLLLLFSRWAPVVSGFVAILGVTSVASFFAFEGMIPGGREASISLALSAGVATALVFLMDRLIAPRLPELAATLVLPSASVSLLYLSSLGAPFGTWGNDGYAQGELLIIARFASLFGLWGVAFLPYWLASVVVTRAERWGRAKTALSVPAVMVVAAFVAGHGLLSGLGWTKGVTEVRTAITAIEIDGLPDHMCRTEDLLCKQKALDGAINAPLFALSSRAAADGATLIAWHEGAALAYARHEDDLVARARDFASTQGVYLVAALGILPDDFPTGLIENKVVVISPEGQVSAPYFKARPVPGEPIVKGDGVPVLVDTPFGRIGLLVCFDADFTGPAREAARAGAELLVVPSNDWPAITPLHGEMTRFRAIENGVTLLRPASNGLAVAYDETGVEQVRRTPSRDQTGYIVFDLKIGARETVHRIIGDSFALAALACLGMLIIAAIAMLVVAPKQSKAKDTDHV